MEDLVGVGVSDPGKQTRVGKCALQRVVLRRDRLPKAVAVNWLCLDSQVSLAPAVSETSQVRAGVGPST